MKILVIGATGYAGTYIAAALRRDGHHVLGLTRDPASVRARRLAAMEVQPVQGDVSDVESYRAYLDDADVVVHAMVDNKDPKGSDQRFFAELKAAEARDGRRRHLVYTTGCSIYGKVSAPVLDETTPGNPDHMLHHRLELEAALAASGLHYTVIRPGFIYGGDARTCLAGRWFGEGHAGKAVYYGDTKKSWSWVHVEDLAEAYVAVVAGGRRFDGEIFCVADEQRILVLDVFVACIRLSGHVESISHEPVTNADWIYKAFDQNEVMTSAKARRQLGWTPRHSGILDELGTYYRTWQASGA